MLLRPRGPWRHSGAGQLRHRVRGHARQGACPPPRAGHCGVSFRCADRLLGLLAMIKSRASTHSCFPVFGFLAMIKSRASTHSCSRLAGLGHRRRLAELGPDGCRELSSASGPPRQATAAQRRAADAHVLHARHRRSAGTPQRCRQEVPPPPAPSRLLGYDQVAGFDAFLLIAMLHSCVRLFGHSRCCRSTGFANRRWALLLLTRRPLRVFVRRSLLTPDGPCLSVWVQSLACGVFVRRALRTPDGPFLGVWVQNLACGVCLCVCVILGVSVCVCVCVSFSGCLCVSCGVVRH